jgi:hypothetical protein
LVELKTAERWMDQLIKAFQLLSVDGCLNVLFAACNADMLAQIHARIGDHLEWERSQK